MSRRTLSPHEGAEPAQPKSCPSYRRVPQPMQSVTRPRVRPSRRASRVLIALLQSSDSPSQPASGPAPPLGTVTGAAPTPPGTPPWPRRGCRPHRRSGCAMAGACHIQLMGHQNYYWQGFTGTAGPKGGAAIEESYRRDCLNPKRPSV